MDITTVVYKAASVRGVIRIKLFDPNPFSEYELQYGGNFEEGKFNKKVFTYDELKKFAADPDWNSIKAIPSNQQEDILENMRKALRIKR